MALNKASSSSVSFMYPLLDDLRRKQHLLHHFSSASSSMMSKVIVVLSTIAPPIQLKRLRNIMAARFAASRAERVERVAYKLLLHVWLALIDSHWKNALACEN
ncbi:hypothetical protein AAUI01_26335, partial [Pseudomonas mosselii]|uniref:hypothetical protein n=1 Tax=Pseudomonas mosselii TaxID=78327 RepID=UPI0032E38FCB